MGPTFDALPDEVAAEREKSLRTAAELAVANAKAAEDQALIAVQKLRIVRLERQVYGQRSERAARLIEQLSLAFEELAASASCSTPRRSANAAAVPGCASSAKT